MRCVCLAMLVLACHISFSQQQLPTVFTAEVDNVVIDFMNEGDIPGLSLVMIKDGQQIIKSYGFADAENKVPVTPNTIFELGSCSKAFTALAVADLVSSGKLDPDSTVSFYIPWFWTEFEDHKVQITVQQLLHHTSGLPWNTISKIPQSNAVDALDLTVRQIVGERLRNKPGTVYEYATINYDILALLVSKVSGMTFEEYLQQNVIDKLDLVNTTVGTPRTGSPLSVGYKIGFFIARPYDAPRFKGNNAAGYVLSNATDVASWLQFQLGIHRSPISDLISATHQRDEMVAPHGVFSYAMGWDVSLRGDGEIYHNGLNPNFSSYIAFRPNTGLGVAILANSNSSYTDVIGRVMMKILAGEELKTKYAAGDGWDKAFSIVSLVLVLYICIVIILLARIIWAIAQHRRMYDGFSWTKFRKLSVTSLALVPFFYALYILPQAMVGFSWTSMLVWLPISVETAVTLIVVSIGITLVVNALNLFFPEKKPVLSIAMPLLLFSILSGLANMIVIILITSSLGSDTPLKYLVFFYVLTALVYLLGRRYVQVQITKVSRKLTCDLQGQLIDKVLSTSYQKFEKMDRGRVYTAFNDDVNVIGDSANTFIVLATSLITAIGAFLYLATIAFWATMTTVVVILMICTVYYFVGKSADVFFEKARDARNVFMRLTSGMIDGYKEISLHRKTKLEYRDDILGSAVDYKEKMTTANIRFVNAFLVGESLFVALLGIVAFAIPKMFDDIQLHVVMSFVIVLLYLIGPVNGILGSIPAIFRFRISLKRLKNFLGEIPENIDLKTPSGADINRVESIRAHGISYTYHSPGEMHPFRVGPIDLEVSKGEIMFIIGGNGSGKTTLAKLLAGLYEPDEGEFLINGKVVRAGQLGECFSAVFSPPFLFEKLYNIDSDGNEDDIRRYLKLLDLEEKVSLVGNRYSTIDLSGGQRKRLALMQCFLEDSPIYLFDEWAADQDPAYRNFFYRTLLPEMRAQGKIVIAITHDDHYFDVADKVLKMDQGKLTRYSGELIFAPNQQ